MSHVNADSQRSQNALPPGPNTGFCSRLAGLVPNGPRNVVVEAGEMVQLLGQVIYSAVRHPRGYWSSSRDEAFNLLKLSAVPAGLTVGGYTFMVVTFSVILLGALGAANRTGAIMFLLNVRELASFLTAMAVAGFIGTAIAADLGSRKTRDELDALRVMGVDPIRLLVLPRIVAAAVMSVGLYVYAIVIGVLLGLFGVVVLSDAVSVGWYFTTLVDNTATREVWNGLIKSVLFGLLIGVVCAYKGLTSKGGPEGVGRAVNQGVVISFIGLWVLNSLANAISSGISPDLGVLR